MIRLFYFIFSIDFLYMQNELRKGTIIKKEYNYFEFSLML